MRNTANKRKCAGTPRIANNNIFTGSRMNTLLFLLILILCSFTVFAQDNTTDELKTLSETKQYEKIIKQYASQTTEYSAKSLYYIGYAYFSKQDDNNCLKFINMSIAKDATDPAALYIKATTLNYKGKYKEAIESFETAITLKPDDAEFHSGLGDSYSQLENYDEALKSYTKATELTNCPDRPYSMIAQIYSDLKQNEKALQAYYTAKTKISKTSSAYKNALFNIALLESQKGNQDKAEPILLELIQLDSTEYHAYAKLIQVYYHKREYDRAKPYKDKLYAAHKKGVLKDNLKDMFCIDQFTWDDYAIRVFERYENENKGEIYNKHMFYVLDKSNKILLRVQTEFSPFSVNLGGPKYLLCATKGGSHYNSGIGFNDDVDYDNLKAAAIKQFEKLVE